MTTCRVCPPHLNTVATLSGKNSEWAAVIERGVGEWRQRLPLTCYNENVVT